MARRVSRRELMVGAGASVAAAGAAAIGAGEALADDREADGSWKGVVAAVQGDRARVAGDGAGDRAWRPVASTTPLQVGDEVVVGPVDPGGPEVVSPLYRSVDGAVQRLCITNRASGGIRTAKTFARGG